jgi:hypothetical protein
MKRKKKVFVILISVLAGFGILSLFVYYFINPYYGTVKHYQGTLPLQDTITKKEAMEDPSEEALDKFYEIAKGS